MWLDHSYPIYFCMSFVTGTTKIVSPDHASRRLILGVLLSITLHAIVLSLQFGIPGLGLPGIELPWNKRRAELTPELTPLIVQLQVAPPPASVAIALSATPSAPEVLPVQSDSAAVDIEPKTLRLQAYVPKQVVSLTQAKPVQKKKKSKTAPQVAAKPVAVPILPVPAAPREPIETPVRIIAQEQAADDSFVVPMPSPDEPVHKATDSKQAQQQVNQIIAEPDESNEVREAEAARLAALALAKERELALVKQDLQARRMREAQERLVVAQIATQLLEQQVQQQAELAKQKQKAAKKMAEESRQQAEENAMQQARQQAAVLAMQKQVSEQIEQERRKRVEQQELAQSEALQQERQKRQEQQASEHKAKEQQAALELAMRKQAEELERQQLEQKLRLQAAIRQKQAEEAMAKQQAEQLIERQRAEELARRKAAEQKLAEQKLTEQKLVEQKLAEQKIAEQKIVEQKERERAFQTAALSAANQAANHTANNAVNNAAAADALSGNPAWPKDIFSSDLANRSKQQLREMDALRAAPPLARKTETDERSRRHSILGSLEREVPLRMYVDSWRQKIERNGNLNYSQVSKDKARGDPVAVVVLRSDGSVEDVTILRSSGRADLDEAVKRIVRVNAPYAAFPPNIAAKYDVIEIRRIWSFEDSLKLVEELR